MRCPDFLLGNVAHFIHIRLQSADRMYRGFIGPPAGGALYGKFGIRGPFIFTILVTAVDFVLRCLIIERKTAILYGVDPAAPPPPSEDVAEEEGIKDETKTGESIAMTVQVGGEQQEGTQLEAQPSELRDQPLSLFGVLKVFLKSPRAIATIYNTLTYGYVCDWYKSKHFTHTTFIGSPTQVKNQHYHYTSRIGTA